MTILNVPIDMSTIPAISDNAPCFRHKSKSCDWSDVDHTARSNRVLNADVSAWMVDQCRNHCPTGDFLACLAAAKRRRGDPEDNFDGQVIAGDYYETKSQRSRKDVTRATAEDLAAWVVECCTPDGRTLMRPLHSAFAHWCQERDLMPPKMAHMGVLLAGLGYPKVGTRTVGGSRLGVRQLTVKD